MFPTPALTADVAAVVTSLANADPRLFSWVADNSEVLDGRELTLPGGTFCFADCEREISRVSKMPTGWFDLNQNKPVIIAAKPSHSIRFLCTDGLYHAPTLTETSGKTHEGTE